MKNYLWRLIYVLPMVRQKRQCKQHVFLFFTFQSENLAKFIGQAVWYASLWNEETSYFPTAFLVTSLKLKNIYVFDIIAQRKAKDSTKYSHTLLIEFSQTLTFCLVYLICLSTYIDFSLLNYLRVTFRRDVSLPLKMLKCVFLTNKDLFLYN